MHRGGREGGANYLQVVTKDTLEDHVGLSISIVRLASRGGIQLASLKEIFFLFQMQLSAKCLVIFQLTISILGVLRRFLGNCYRLCGILESCGDPDPSGCQKREAPPPAVVLGTRCHTWVSSSTPMVCSKEGAEAVPRIPETAGVT